MAYIPLPRREPFGFYDPNMAGPNWAQGIAGLLGDLQKRREDKRSREKEEHDREMAERKQVDVEAGTAAYTKDVETRRRVSEKPPQPGAAERFFMKKYEIAKTLWTDPKKQYAWATNQVQDLYPPGTGDKPKKQTGIAEWINKTDSRLVNEHGRLRGMGKDLSTARSEAQKELDALADTSEGGVSEDPKLRKAHRKVQEINEKIVENDSAMKNLVQAIDYLPQIRNAYEQNGQVATSEMMQAITDISSSMEAIKRGGFFDQHRQPQRQPQRQPGTGGQQRPPEQEMHPFIKRFLDENPDAMTDPALQKELAAIQAAINQMQQQ